MPFPSFSPFALFLRPCLGHGGVVLEAGPARAGLFLLDGGVVYVDGWGWKAPGGFGTLLTLV